MGLFFHHLISAAESCSSIICRRISINKFRSFNYHYSSSSRISSSRSFQKKSWSSPAPWLMLPPSFEEGMKYNFYSLSENKVVSFNKNCGESEVPVPEDESQIVGSSHGWLALYNPRNFDLFLSNPLTRRHIKLPPLHSLGIPDETFIYKVIISCDDPESDSNECRVLMTFGLGTLAFCSPHSDEWTPIGNRFTPGGSVRWYSEFVYDSRHKLFFCFSPSNTVIEAWDINDQQQPRIVWASHDDGETNTNFFEDNLPEGFFLNSQFSYVIVHSDQLYFVSRDSVYDMAPDGSQVEFPKVDDDYPYKTVGFHVYRIDREGQKLIYMEEGSLDGLVMFVGLNHSFALPASQFPGLKPNSIYFTDEHDMTPHKFVESAYGGHDIGVFDYESKTISPCYYPCDVQSFKRIMPAPLWFTPSQASVRASV